MTKEAFEEKSMALLDTMYRVSATLLRRPEDRQDVIQSCLLKAWQYRHRLTSPDAFKPWVMRILINECHTLLRKNRRMVLTDAPEESVEAPDMALKACLEALPVKLREVAALFYMEGWPMEMIAKTLLIPMGTVKSRLSRARKRLQEEWQEEVWP